MSASNRRVIAIGGGHGLARTLEALLLLEAEPTAVVTVADDGGSSGRLRQQHGVTALGDMRMALQTLAVDDRWGDLLGHRFADGDLHGHALGNLVLLALVQRNDGDVVAAVQQAAGLLGCRGSVLPCTTDDVTLFAEIDGRTVAGQVTIATAVGHRGPVWLEPRDPDACTEAVAAIDAADAVVLGPGSLFTSIIPNLLVPGISQAVARSTAPLIYIANLTKQPGETGGMDLQAHVDALLRHLPDRDVLVLAHDGPTAPGSGEPLGIDVTHERVHGLRTADLAGRQPDGTTAPAHDAERLARALGGLLPVVR